MLLEGHQINQYRFVRLLRSGGMGEVYLAHDEHLDRYVAIKVIRTDTSRYPDTQAAREAAQLFLSEMQAIARLDHMNILPVYGSGENSVNDARLMYMIMPYRRHGSLADWLQKRGTARRLSLQDVERIVKQAANALQHAHNHHIIHQDIKPSNFLIQGEAEHPGQLNLQLADFGVAKLMTTTSENQTIRGTPTYMAPEQWDGHPVPAADQYALAVMAYELLTGYPPFIANNNHQMWHLHCYVPPRPPSAINPAIPQELDAVLLRALSKNPDQRYRSVAAFARAFQQAIPNSDNILATNSMEETASPITHSEEATKVSVSDPNTDVIPFRQRGRGLVSKPILMIFLTLALIAASVLGFFVLRSYPPKNSNPIAKNTEIKGTVTRSFSSTSTATAHATANPTAFTKTVTSGSPVLNDPLQSNSGNNWDVTNLTGGGGCAFTGGAYHASMPQKSYISPCFAQATNFNNFLYQLQMTIIKGDQGGIAFRADPSKGAFYYFHISTGGAYALETYNNYNPSNPQPLIQGTSPAIKTGLNQTNLITVVANGNSLKFFLNMQPIASISDNTYAAGKIGVIAEDISNPTEVVFRNVVVWPL